MSALALRLSAAQVRHALRTPLNHIAGYSDMLLEDLPCDTPKGFRDRLETIRAKGRVILDLVQEELPAHEPEIQAEHINALRLKIFPELEAIIEEVGKSVCDPHARASGINLSDLLRIGSAVAELMDLTSGGLQIRSNEPLLTPHEHSMAAASGAILIVDDNPKNRDLLARMLEKQGFSTHLAADGKAALAEVNARHFDLILLDLMMPEMDGVAVLQRLRAEPQWRGIPVIMLSALDETWRVIQCLDMGAEDYVVKPFDPVLLTARLRSTLERSRLQEAELSRARELEAAYEKLRDNEHRLLESEERLRLATEAAEVGIWYFYSHQNRVLMTRDCKRIFGFPENDSVLQLHELVQRMHPEDRERAEAELQRAIATQSELDMEFRIVVPDGSVKWVSSRGMAQRHGAAQETRLAGVAIDITARKQAEEALRQSAKLESIGLLAGGIAHDFNNLLTGIIGSASFVLDSLDAGSPHGEMLKNVVNAGERASDLTKQLLAYSGRGKFSVRKLDLSKLVGEIAALVRASVSRTVRVERDLDENLPRIEGDSTQIQQIVMNLVINGSEAIPDEGTVRISTGIVTLDGNGRENFIFGEKIRPGDYVYLEVSDNGAGMQRELVNRIFEPFFTTKFTGRGLGLAAVFGIVRGHEGALEVETAPGKGSRFRIYFPPAPRETVRKGGEPSKVLFIDDESVVRVMGKTALERAGLEVILAENGEQALRHMRENREQIALAVIDLTMPGWSGFETFRRLKQIRPDLDVILSSGFSEEELRARYPGERFGLLLKKPYMAATLVARVRELRERSQAEV